MLDARPSESNPDRGIVYVETRDTSQCDELVMTFRRHMLIPRRITAAPRGEP